MNKFCLKTKPNFTFDKTFAKHVSNSNDGSMETKKDPNFERCSLLEIDAKTEQMSKLEATSKRQQNRLPFKF